MIICKKNVEYRFEYDEMARFYCYLNRPIVEMGMRHRRAVIICPGGGFDTWVEREGYPVASRFMGMGYQAFILKYHIGRGSYRIAVRELQESISFIKKNASEWDVDPEGIVVVGFSVGGLIALGLAGGVHTVKKFDDKIVPNALILGYPIVTSGKYTHEPSISNCVDGDIQREDLSMEKIVTDDFPPCFIFGCADDNDVSIKNSLLLADALSEHDVPFSLHIFSKGGHGLSLGDDCSARVNDQINDNYAKWFPMSLSWLDEVL